jgi:5,10-methylenetetrahydrofolate reductase
VDEDEEITHLKEKVDAGADFIVTQLFYDVDGFLKWAKKVRKQGQYVHLDPRRCIPSAIPQESMSPSSQASCRFRPTLPSSG